MNHVQAEFFPSWIIHLGEGGLRGGGGGRVVNQMEDARRWLKAQEAVHKNCIWIYGKYLKQEVIFIENQKYISVTLYCAFLAV